MSNRLSRILSDHRDAILILVSMVLLLLVVLQNFDLRKKIAACENSQSALADRLKLSTEMSRLVGARIPFHDKVRASLVQQPVGSHGTVVVVFNPTACGKCIREQLAIVESFRGRVGPQDLSFLALIGLESDQDRQWALTLRDRKLLTFPFLYDASENLARSFPLKAETGYTDTPIYLLIDGDLRIRSAFKPDRQTPQQLEDWLRTLVDDTTPTA